MQRFQIVLLTVLWILISIGWANAALSWTTFTTRDGLASNSVTSIFEDTQGNMWFWPGATKYDGLNWTRFHEGNFVISEATIGIILEDSEGNQWVRRQNDVVRYKPGIWKPFDLPDWPIIDAKGNIWFEKDGRLKSFHDGKWIDVPLPDDMFHRGEQVPAWNGKWIPGIDREESTILEDRQGNIWMGIGSYHSYRMRMAYKVDFPLYEYRLPEGKWVSYKMIVNVEDIFEDSRGNIWVAGAGAYRYDGKTWRRFTTKDGLVDNSVNVILEDSRGNMWFGASRGVSKYSNGSWTTFTKDDGLASNWILTIYEDRMGNLWFGTHLSGVSRYSNAILKSIPVNKLAGIRTILKDKDGNLWFATAHGATVYNGRTWVTYPFTPGLASYYSYEAWKNPPHYDPQYRYYNDLAVNAVFSIHMDEQGWLYFGTLDGTLHIMSHVDPESMTSADYVVKPPYQSPIGPIIWAIATEEDTGNVWLGTQDGAMGFYGEGEKEFGPPPSAPSSVTDFPVRSILKDADGRLWFGTDGAGISVCQGKAEQEEAEWINFRASDDGLADNHVRTLMQDKQGRIWAGTLNGVSIYENSRWRPFKMPSQLAGYPIMVIFEDTQGNYWFGTEGGGAGRYDGLRWLIFTSANGLVEDAVWSIAEDEKGYLWFGTASGGVIRYDNREREWTIFTQVTDYSLNMDLTIYNGVYSIFEDNRGSLWFTTRGGGVIRYDGKRWSTFTTSNGLGDDYVYDVFVDSRGTAWVITRRGLYQSNERGWAFFNVNDARVNVVFEDREGNLWFGTGRGAVKYDGEPKTTVLEREKIGSIFQDSKGNLWFRTNNGIIKYDGITFTPFPEIGTVRTIIEDDAGNIWITHERALGVDRYDGQQWARFTYEKTNGGLVDGNIIVIYPDKRGNVWFGTSDGLSKFDGVNWQNYTVSHRLTFNKLHAILQDDRGILWLGTDNGVVKFDGTTWITVTTIDGLPDDRVYAMLQDRRGDIWLGTAGGPVQHKLDRIPPKVQIVSGPKEGSVVTDSNVSFVFEGGDLVSPQKDLIFSVRLDPKHPLPSNLNPGNLEQWSQYSSETTAAYTNLPDGGYVFRVIAKDKDLNSASISREFIIDTKQPEVDIDEPEPGQMLRGFCNIRGTSTDKDFQKYSIEVKYNKDGAVVYSQTFSQKVKKGELATWNTRNQPDGEYTITLRVTSLKGEIGAQRMFENTDEVTVIVDNTPPKIQLIRPVMNEQVSGEIQILGTAYDENFKEYIVEYGKGTNPSDSNWKPISKQPIQTPVWENELLSWNTVGKSGEYSIRLRVLDQAGNEVEQKVAVVVQTPVVRSKGREIKANDQKARIYIPPNSLPESTSQLVITINKVPESQIQPSINKNIIPTGIAYDFEPRNVSLNRLKPASLTLPYGDALLAPTEINNLAVFVWNESKKDWDFVGGRIDKPSETIKTSVLKLGRYSIMKIEKEDAKGKTVISKLTCQPRVFSPNGGGFSTTTYISFHLNRDSKVTVKIYNLEGYLKKTLIEREQLPQGNNRIDWNGRDSNDEVVPSGAYAIVLKAEGAERVATKTVVVLNDR